MTHRAESATGTAPPWLLLAGFALYVALVVSGLRLESATAPLEFDNVWSVFVLVSWYLIGALIIRRHPSHPIGWILCAAALAFGGSYFCEAYMTNALARNGSGLPPVQPVAWVGLSLWVLGLTLSGIFLPVLFPNGRLPSPRWRPIVWLGAALIPIAVVIYMSTPGLLPSIENPISLGGADELLDRLNAGVVAVFLSLALLSLLSVFMRARRANRVEQLQIKWFSYAAAIFFLAFVVDELTALNPDLLLVSRITTVVAATALPLAVAIAVLRYRLYDIDLLINRTILYAALTGVLGGIYTASIALFQRAFVATTGQNSDLAIVMAIFVLATSFTPIRAQLQSALDHYFKPTSSGPARGADLDDLEKLAQLHSRGILTDEEFAAKKKRVLGI
jgi:hypothetical protein